MSVPASVIVVSRGRPDELRRCLTGLCQMGGAVFEIIVVADPAGCAAAAGFPARTVAFDQPNIAVARNLGIAAARGAVVAFIDDDAVPEPDWLRHLVAPFADPAVAAAGGHVVGANGISFEWAGGTVGADLETAPLVLEGDATVIPVPPPGRAIEIKGVNCSYRRDVVAAIGGFDPLLPYYLDETELNLRLRAQGARVAVVPMARVHHAKAASAQRRADRAPRRLFEVGFSTAVTLRRHGAADPTPALADLVARERRKLLSWMVSGHLEPRDVGRLLDDLCAGFRGGCGQVLLPLCPIKSESGGMVPVTAAARPVRAIAGRVWQRRALHRTAAAHVREGGIARVFCFSPTALFHRVRYMPSGYWLQTGGLFGRSLRSDPLFRFWSFPVRCARERNVTGPRCGNS